MIRLLKQFEFESEDEAALPKHVVYHPTKSHDSLSVESARAQACVTRVRH